MITGTHVFVACAAFAKPNAPARNTGLVLGGLLPDAVILVVFLYARLVLGASEQEVWDVHYFDDRWTPLYGLFNSIPIFVLMFAVGLWQNWSFVWGLGFAGALHGLLDLPVHHDDGHPHFWPFTNWVYESPLSYWDDNHFGQYVSLFDIALMVVSALIVFLRFKSLWVRVMIIAFCLLVLAPIAYWKLSHG